MAIQKKVRKLMPSSFRKDFPNTRAIIDCTEVFIQNPATQKPSQSHIVHTNLTILPNY